MKLRKMEFGGFRTFAAPTTFDFGGGPGLYFLEGGRNEIDPSLGSNGVGKSTLWSAVCWILFGKTAEGLKAGDLKSWQSNEKGYYGKLWIGRYLVHRKWNPNKLTLDGEVVEQKVLEEQLGINFDTFTSAVVLAQGGDMFFDLLPAKKLALFTAMLKLDNWTTYSSIAKATADELQEKLHVLERNISKLEGKLDGLQLEGLQEKRKAWRSKKSKIETEIKGELVASETEAASLKRITAQTKKNKTRLGKQFKEQKEVTDLAFENYTEAAADEEKMVWEAARLKESISAGYKHRKQVAKTKKGACLHCGQTINKGRLSGHVKDLDDALDGLRGQLTVLAIDCERLEGTKDMYNEELVTAQYTQNKTKKRLTSAKENLAELSHSLALVVASIDSKKQRLKASHKEKNPFIPMIAELEEEEQRITEKLGAKEKQHGRLQKRKADTAFWIAGFKDVRLYLIEEALVQLEIETNKALADLGFTTDWRIRYSIEKRSKTGHSISGFNVAVQSPHSTKAVPFAAWSGGEKQRLKIAGSIGFISLMSARTGLELGIEVYDEPTQHLSPQGIDSLLETLRQRSMETGKRIWLVDHHTLDYGDFTGRAVVSKKEGGSTLWQS